MASSDDSASWGLEVSVDGAPGGETRMMTGDVLEVDVDEREKTYTFKLEDEFGLKSVFVLRGIRIPLWGRINLWPSTN